MTFMGSWTLSSPGGGGWSLLTTTGEGERPGGLSNEDGALSLGEIICEYIQSYLKIIYMLTYN